MQSLLPIEKIGDQYVISAQLLHDYFGEYVGFDNWFSYYTEHCGLVAQEDFWPALTDPAGYHIKDDFVTLHIAKYLSSCEHSADGQEVYNYLVAQESRLYNLVPQPAPVTPKMVFFKSVDMHAWPMKITDAAKKLAIPGINRTALFRLLRADNVLDETDSPSAYHRRNGLFEVSTYYLGNTRSGARLRSTTKVTGKGLKWLYNRYYNAAWRIEREKSNFDQCMPLFLFPRQHSWTQTQ